MHVATAPWAMVAGEASGDLLASMLLGAMRERWPGLRAVGIGGPLMAQQGFEAWWPHHKLAVHGVVVFLVTGGGLHRQLVDRERAQLQKQRDAW